MEPEGRQLIPNASDQQLTEELQHENPVVVSIQDFTWLCSLTLARQETSRTFVNLSYRNRFGICNDLSEGNHVPIAADGACTNQSAAKPSFDRSI